MFGYYLSAFHDLSHSLVHRQTWRLTGNYRS